MAETLNGFDMILALTENAVNAQLFTLFKEAHDPKKAMMPTEVSWPVPGGRGVIKASLGPTRVSFMPNNDNYQNATFILPLVKGIFESFTFDVEILEDADGVPLMDENNNVKTKTTTTVHKHPINHWQMAFVVDLAKMAFTESDRQAAHAEGALSSKAHETLQSYPDNLFDVSALVLDFVNKEISSFDPDHTKMPGLSADEKISMHQALSAYFKTERKQPYIIAIHTASKNPLTTATAVEPTIVPTAVQFTTLGNATVYNKADGTPGPAGGLSTLNYLTTTGGAAPKPAKPNGIFTSPFVTDNKSSGRLLIKRTSFVDNFLLKNLGNHLGSAFAASHDSPLIFTSTTKGSGISYQHGSFFTGHVNGSGSVVTNTKATLSTTAPEILISGTIATSSEYQIQYIWKGTWKVWRNIDFNAKISIKATEDSHSLAVKFDDFQFGKEYKPRSDSKDTGANVDNVLNFGMIDKMINNLMSSYSSSMESNQESILTQGSAAMPNVFIPPTGDKYSLKPIGFNAVGDLLIDVNIETK